LGLICSRRVLLRARTVLLALAHFSETAISIAAVAGSILLADRATIDGRPILIRDAKTYQLMPARTVGPVRSDLFWKGLELGLLASSTVLPAGTLRSGWPLLEPFRFVGSIEGNQLGARGNEAFFSAPRFCPGALESARHPKAKPLRSGSPVPVDGRASLAKGALGTVGGYLVDPASSHMLV
jgi:hypothetical protein